MLSMKIPIIAVFNTDGKIVPIYGKINTSEGSEVVHFVKVDQLYDDDYRNTDFLKFRCRYLLEETGLSREIEICFVAREHVWYVIS